MNRQQQLHLWLFFGWVFVGGPVSYFLMQSVPWVVFMSLYAIWSTHLSGFSGATPVEKDQ